MSTFSILTQDHVSVLLQNGAVVARVPESLGSGYSPTAGTMAIRDIIREVEADYPRAPQRTQEAHIRQRLRKLATSQPLRYHARLVDCYSPSLLGEKGHGSSPTAAELEAAARDILRSGIAATNMLGRAKIWLSDLYERFASRMSRDEFNGLLRRLRRSGEILET